MMSILGACLYYSAPRRWACVRAFDYFLLVESALLAVALPEV